MVVTLVPVRSSGEPVSTVVEIPLAGIDYTGRPLVLTVLFKMMMTCGTVLATIRPSPTVQRPGKHFTRIGDHQPSSWANLIPGHSAVTAKRRPGEVGCTGGSPGESR